LDDDRGRDFLVRQLNDHKAAIANSELKSAALLEYAAVCGETLARGHARAGDPCMIAGYMGTSARFDEAIAHFAADYADQTERDWEALVRSRRGGKPPLRLKPSNVSERSAGNPANTDGCQQTKLPHFDEEAGQSCLEVIGWLLARS